MKKIFLFLLVILTLGLIVVWQIFWADTTSWYVVAAVLLVLSAVPFFARFEHRAPTARELSLLAVMTALAVVSRAAFYLVPQVKPIAAVVIVTAVCLGPYAGYMNGAMAALLSNFIFGQGIWTPFQMAALGLVGLVSGLVLKPKTSSPIKLAITGFVLSTVLYGLVVDLSTVLMTVTQWNWKSVAAVYAAGIPFDLVFGASTAVFLFVFGMPLQKKICRIQIKYGLFLSTASEVE